MWQAGCKQTSGDPCLPGAKLRKFLTAERMDLLLVHHSPSCHCRGSQGTYGGSQMTTGKRQGPGSSGWTAKPCPQPCEWTWEWKGQPPVLTSFGNQILVPCMGVRLHPNLVVGVRHGNYTLSYKWHFYTFNDFSQIEH